MPRLPLIIILPLVACTELEPPPVEPAPDAQPVETMPDAALVDPVPLPLIDCAEGRGRLAEVWRAEDEHGAISAQALSPAASAIAVAGADGTIKMWDLDGRDVAWATGPGAIYGSEWGTGAVVNALAFGADGAAMVTGSSEGVLELRDGEGFVHGSAGVGAEVIRSVAMRSDGQLIASADASFGGNLRLWTLADGVVGEPLPTALWNVHAVAFFHNDDLLTAGDWYGVPMVEWRERNDLSVVTWSWRGDGLSDRLPAGSTVRALVPTTRVGGDVIAAGTGFVAVLEPGSLPQDPPRRLHVEPAADFVSAAFLPGEDYLVTAEADGRVRLFGAEDLEERTQTTIDAAPAGVAVDAAGTRLVLGADDGTVRVLACVAE